MRGKIVKKFDKITTDYFNQLKDIDDNYFLNGEVIENVKRNHKDQFYTFILINEYTHLKIVKFLINLFRFLAVKPNLSEISPDIISRYYEGPVLKLITFDRRIMNLIQLEEELYMSNPSECGIVKVLNDFSVDLNRDFIQSFDELSYTLKLGEYDVSYLHDLAKSLDRMLLGVRILMVHSAYFGKTRNPFFVVSKQLLNWLDDIMVDIKSNVNK